MAPLMTPAYVYHPAAIEKITGILPALMRPPYGEYNNNVRQVAASLNQSIVIWDQDSGDSVGQ